MAPQPPLIMLDNVYDTVRLYPGAIVSADDYRTGREPFRVASYRRERSYWSPTTAAANHWIRADAGVGNTRAVDYLFIDRGSNLFGATLQLQSAPDGATWTTARTFILPAAGTIGGDPTTTTGTVTEEGAWWAIFTATAAARYWRILVVDNITPVVTGILLGRRLQLLGFTAGFDEDGSERTEESQQSTAGYKAAGQTYAWRVLEISLDLIGAAEYDASIRALRVNAFTFNQPCVIAMEYGTRPERAWMYQYDGKSWQMPKKRTYRSARHRFREVGPSLA